MYCYYYKQLVSSSNLILNQSKSMNYNSLPVLTLATNVTVSDSLLPFNCHIHPKQVYSEDCSGCHFHYGLGVQDTNSKLFLVTIFIVVLPSLKIPILLLLFVLSLSNLHFHTSSNFTILNRLFTIFFILFYLFRIHCIVWKE